jgi:adenosylcobinamide-phosphate synthase
MLSLVAAFAWNVLVVYMTLGFRHYSHYFTSIQLALNTGDDDRPHPAGRMDQAGHHGMDVSEISRIASERA